MSIADKLETIAENEQKVYDAGRQVAYYDAGKRAAYDGFWDVYQASGRRTSYNNAFSGYGWTDVTFNPKYDIVPIGSALNLFSNAQITDLDKILNDNSVSLDTSLTTVLNYAFSSAVITKVPEVSTVSASSLVSTFDGAHNLAEIKKLILKTDGTQTFEYTFRDCEALKDITVEGVIGRDINLQWSVRLSGGSAVNIIGCLKDYSETAEAYTRTITLSTLVWARANEHSKPSNESGNWQVYCRLLGWNVKEAS